jgi:chromosome segregation ATPase
MDVISDKAWAIIAAIISTLGGYIVYDHKRMDMRLTKVEQDLAQHNTDLAVIKEGLLNLKEGLLNLKEDLQEIKELLTLRRKKL